MHVYILQHVAFEGPGCIGDWLQRRQIASTTIALYRQQPLPAAEQVDWLIVLGGPMGVADEAGYPWLAAEKTLIRAVIDAGKPVLGICLGAQLIASAMGASVQRNHQPEIGWFAVRGIHHRQPSVFHFPACIDAFHWHGDTFALPAGALWLAESDACRHQAFQLGARVIGLQCHLETTPATAAALLEHCHDELVDGEYIQTAEAMLDKPADAWQQINRVMDSILDFLLQASRQA
ncbi:MAG TPA: type 1 glutamine amidotransferase [Pseudomonadales bacterium]